MHLEMLFGVYGATAFSFCYSSFLPLAAWHPRRLQADRATAPSARRVPLVHDVDHARVARVGVIFIELEVAPADVVLVSFMTG
jgi:hypothetical protein